MGLKGARLFVRAQSLLGKETTSWQSHLNDVDRWHPIVVVLGELPGAAEGETPRERRGGGGGLYLTAQQPPRRVLGSAAL